MPQFIKGRHILGTIFILIGAGYLYQTYYNDIFFVGGELEPMDYPRALILIWLFLSALYVIIPRDDMEMDGLKKAAPLLVKILAASCACVALLPRLGFICASFIFLMIFFYLFKDRRYLRMILISIISASALWFIFEIILKTPLPLGIWADLLH